MLSFFANPWTLAAGGLLAATPIIIHLINLMRFKRVKWAAMEFLLKAQKKQRKKKILEQLILLLLRILLVVLAALLFGRFLGCEQIEKKETRPTLHVVILDDTPSMADAGQIAGAEHAFALAKIQLTEKILPALSEATTPQLIQLVRLSDPAAPYPKEPEVVTVSTRDTVRVEVDRYQPVAFRRSLVDGLQRAKQLLEKTPNTDTARVVHVVSDFRTLDWSTEGEAISQAMRDLTEGAGAKVHLIDVAGPYRKPERKVPAFSDNVGITEFRPRNRVAAQNQPIEFEIRVKNFGSTALKDVGVDFFVNGEKDLIGSQPFPTLPAGQERHLVFPATFNRTGTPDRPLDAFNLVTAVLTNTGADALASDNVRHAVVEVRDKLAVLVVSHPEDDPESRKGEGFFLRRLFEDAFGGINFVTAKPGALDTQDLRKFSTIYLLNVPALSESQVRALEAFVKDGGGVGVFLGPKVVPEEYNARMHRNAEGFFPIPLPENPSRPLTPAQRKLRGESLAKRVLVRDAAARTHPALAGLYTNERGAPIKDADIERQFYFAYIDQHWPIPRTGRWREDRSLQELYCLPNDRPVSEFEEPAAKLADAVKLKYGEPKFEKYRKKVDDLLAEVKAVAASTDKPLTELAGLMDDLLADQVTTGDPDEALLREFWVQPEMAEARAMAQSLRDSSKFGDPLYFARRFGNGRVAVMTTDAGGSDRNTHPDGPWTDWPSLGGVGGWVAVVTEMQKYLSGGGPEDNRTVGSTLTATYEAGRYDPTVHVTTVTTPVSAESLKAALESRKMALTFASSTDARDGDEKDPKDGPDGKPAAVGPKPPKKQTLVEMKEVVTIPPPKGDPDQQPKAVENRFLKLTFADADRAGMYVFALKRQRLPGDPPTAPERTEYVAAVFNTDTAREGDLRRANTDDLAQLAKGSSLHSPEDTSWMVQMKTKPTDLSSGRWLYLCLLVVLVLEQAMAVRLSYHSRPEDLDALAPSAAAAFSRGTAAPPAADAAAPGGPPEFRRGGRSEGGEGSTPAG